MSNNYYPVTCPHCQKHIIIRLQQGEEVTTPCQCKRYTVVAVWGMQPDTDDNGQPTEHYAPQLTKEE